jgi:hypothetical protein
MFLLVGLEGSAAGGVGEEPLGKRARESRHEFATFFASNASPVASNVQ